MEMLLINKQNSEKQSVDYTPTEIYTFCRLLYCYQCIIKFIRLRLLILLKFIVQSFF